MRRVRGTKAGYYKLIAAVIFLGLAAYAAVFISRMGEPGEQTAVLELSTVSERITLEGVAVREELVISSAEGLGALPGEGERVSGGSVIAAGPDGLDAPAKGGVAACAGACDDVGRAAAFEDLIAELGCAAQSGSAPERRRAVFSLRAMLGGFGTEQETQNAAAKVICAPCAGVFSYYTDGCESISPEALEGISPGALDALSKRKAETVPCLGRLITGTDWYYAAVISEKVAASLRSGGTAELRFDCLAQAVTASCVYISEAENGRCAAVWRCSSALGGAMYLRHEGAQLVFAEHTGISLPPGAVHREDGEAYVYVKTSVGKEKKTVEIIYESGECCLVSPDERDSVRVGMEVIL